MNSIKLQNKMGTIFMNSENSKTSDPQRLLRNHSEIKNLKTNDKYVALSNLSLHYTWKNIRKSYNNNKFKISAPIWNKKFELPHGLYSASDIQGYLEYIFKKNTEKRLILH